MCINVLYKTTRAQPLPKGGEGGCDQKSNEKKKKKRNSIMIAERILIAVKYTSRYW